jgi:hypothetical protein
MAMLFTRRPMIPGSRPPKEDKTQAMCFKSPAQIEDAWKHIMEKRRLAEPDDGLAINDSDQLADMWVSWQKEWIAKECTDGQKTKKWSQKTSIFNAHVHQHYGGKNFVMAVWQTGISWAPTQEMLESDFNGASEHVVKHFASWTRRLARAVSRHKSEPASQEARARSGSAFGKHGLTPEQLQDRTDRKKARSDYYLTMPILNRYKEGNPWHDMSQGERYWLGEYWNGNLRGAMQAAEAKCHRVQASRFFVADFT